MKLKNFSTWHGKNWLSINEGYSPSFYLQWGQFPFCVFFSAFNLYAAFGPGIAKRYRGVYSQKSLNTRARIEEKVCVDGFKEIDRKELRRKPK